MKQAVENITPYGIEGATKTSQVRDMFDSIAPAYDFMNRAMTMGVDKLWRRNAVNIVAKHAPASILDLATGTGDLAIAIARKLPHAEITGADLSVSMMEIGKEKVAKAGLQDRVRFLQADGTALPLPSNTFDCVTIAYGIRNFEDIAKGYGEMFRVLKPGGHLVVVELATPVNSVALKAYNVYTKNIIPTVGRMVSRDARAYSYLPESIAAVPQREDMLTLMRGAGFTATSFHSMTFGSCIIYVGTKA